ncbi:ABC transporter substrate-binding protein [Geodermatophilus sabuli]|uniref:ABC transporter substrate-binding protein n=1 Tax=Geodermatophilus sabuli TaxID=1564158 RepID=A0A7K3VWV0_9ACTN|nr:ABC transporter substrate-binding protein [Geodermatophilus sabuli]NEK56850.1 ABC transporter substrate-binding protein [Geodermatophilus sabuli]
MRGKHIRAASILAAVTLAVAACGGEAGGDGGGDGGSSGEDLVIGFPVPLTSGNAVYAEQMIDSAQLAVDEINADGGAGGRQLVLETYDDKLSPDESARVAQRAVTVDGAEVIVGGYTSIEGLAIREVTERRKIVYINPSTISPQLTVDAEYTFRVAVDQTEYPAALADLAEQLGLERPALLTDSGATGSTIGPPTEAALDEAGIALAGPATTYELNSTDVTGPVGTVVSQNPDGVLALGSSAADLGLIMKTMVERGLTVPILSVSAIVSPDALTVAGPEVIEALPIYTLVNKLATKPQFIDFVERYQAEYGGDVEELTVTLSEQAANSYDTIKLLAQALEETGGSTDGDGLAEALRGLPPFDAAGGAEGAQISFADSQTGFSDSLVASQFVDGALQAVA